MLGLGQYRYETIVALNWPLDAELALMDERADKYLKTYQVWHHRRLLRGGACDIEDGDRWMWEILSNKLWAFIKLLYNDTENKHSGLMKQH
ncbi:hypothetical protein DFH09DRAFT_1357567 [Mycena vulgaris]|nr:hypothetical protein DFH09DRAFT_1357567 [Mycena vulgaris]